LNFYADHTVTDVILGNWDVLCWSYSVF